MGKDLERAMWRMYAPHKVKFAVSGCPRNCAEAGIKDVGIIGVDSGLGDVRGRQRRHQDRGGAVLGQTERPPDEVLEYTGAFCQLYRLKKAGTWSARCTT